MIEPVHTAEINSIDVRFFRSPLEGPDFPWHAVDDLAESGGLPSELGRNYRKKLFRDWHHKIRQVMVKGELVMIAPHHVGQVMSEFIDGYQPGFSKAYIKASAAAERLVTADMTWEERLDFTLSAGKRGRE